MQTHTAGTIAVVGFPEETQEMLMRLLERGGYPAQAFPSVEDAAGCMFDRSAQGCRHLLITHLSPPDLAGWRICRWLREAAIAARVQVKILLIAEHLDGEEVRQITLAAGGRLGHFPAGDGAGFLQDVAALWAGEPADGTESLLTAEEAAGQAMERYRVVAEQSRTVFWEVDAEGRYTYVSHVSLTVWGYQPTELVGIKCFYDLHPESGRAMFRQMALEVFARKEVLADLKNPVQRKDGSTIWVSTTGVPLLAPTGELLGYRGSDTDITARHRAEIELEAQRQKLANVIEGTHAGTWEWNVQTGEATFDRRWAEIVGYRLEELGNTSIRTWVDLVHPDDNQKSGEILAEHFAGKRANYDCECRMKHKDGSWVWVHDRGKVMEWDENAAPMRMAGTHTDITARKKAEQALHDSQEWLRMAIECSAQAQERFELHMQGTPMAYLEMGAEGRITYWNPAAERIFGYRLDEVMGRTPDEILRGAAEAVGTSLFPHLLQGNAATRTTVEHRTKNGRRIVCEWSTTRLVSALGKSIGTACLGQDITELKSALDQLRKSKEAAEAATRAKSEFLSTMSHEIRTPMNGIIGMSSLLIDSPLPAEQMTFAQAIRSSADALLAVINDILDFSKVEAGKLEIERVPFNLQTAIEAVVDLVTLRAQEKGLELTVWYAPGAPREYEGDVGRVRQILLNLVTNAIKFTDSGHVLIEVSWRPDEAGMDEIRIAVQDTGVGIPRDKFDRLFSQFTQLDSSARRRWGGSGLGLAISKRLARLMNGDIHVISEPGEGSTFTLHIPLLRRPGADCVSELPVELRGVRVLVVEDHQISRFVCAEWCESWGMRVEEAPSAAAAMMMSKQARLDKDPFGIYLVDHQLADSSGGHLARWLHAGSGKGIPIVLLTAYDFRHFVNDHAREFAATVSKPVRPNLLLEALRGALHCGQSTVSARQVKAAQAEERNAFAGVRVLLVEDNAINQRVATALLQKLGCHVEFAGNGREALQMVVQFAFDVVFMDCQMPEMDGFEATAAIRRLPAPACALPIIALTAGAMEADREKCMASGMNDYLAKPVMIHSFREMLTLWHRQPDAQPSSLAG